MEEKRIQKLKEVGAWDIIAIPESHPIISRDVHNYDPNSFLLYRQALVEAFEAAKPYFTESPKYEMHPDTWNVLAVLSGVRKWFKEVQTRMNTLRDIEAVEREQGRNMWRDPHQVVQLASEVNTTPPVIQITEEDILDEFNFWNGAKERVMQAISEYEAQKMQAAQAMLMQMQAKPSNRGMGAVQAMGGNTMLPKSHYSIPGSEEYGGAKPKPRSSE